MQQSVNHSNHQPLPASLERALPGDRQRREFEAYVSKVFRHAYDARVSKFMPELLGIRDAGGELVGTLGIRRANDGPLFLEQYLDRPVDVALSEALAAFGTRITRDMLVEVGNLAATHAGGTRWLIIALTAYLQGAGYDWVVFTATPSLRNSFRKLGLRMIPLGEASLEQLPEADRAAWGRYYDGGPQVIAVNVHHTYGVLERELRLERALHLLKGMWDCAYRIGATRLGAMIEGAMIEGSMIESGLAPATAPVKA